MRQIYKRLLTTLVLISATQTSSVVQAEGIRLVGPSGEVQSSPRYAEEMERALVSPPANSQPSRFIGPTGENQTLWSIASQLRPSASVSVQQTLLAIYRINPQAFENQNIHELIPGSRLRVPSLEQVQSATTEQAVAIMKAHEAKLKQPKPVKKVSPAKPVVQQPAPQSEKPQPQVKEVQTSVKPKTPVADQSQVIEPVTPVPPVNTSPEGEQQVTELKSKLQGSQSELASLEEKNHRLRLMLSEVQSEVQTLKSELNDEERIRSEVEKLLEEERQRAADQLRMQPSTLDKILSNGWLVGIAALIPGVLLALLVVMLMGRRSKQKEEQAADQASSGSDILSAPIGMAAADELEEELSLDDDLFADDESDELSSKDDITELEDDVFAGLEDEDLDFNLEGDDGEDPFAGIGDDGDLDVGFDEFDSSTNGIKVNGEEKALGLEEMERALDEAPSAFENLEDPDFDLSDPDANEEDAFAELLAEDSSSDEVNDGHIDQATLDDLFAELNSDDLDLSTESSSASDKAFSAGTASGDEIDDLLAQFEQPNSAASDSELDRLFDLNNQDSLNTAEESDPLEQLADISGLSDNADIDEDSTDLLDELIDFDDEESDDEFDPLNELESLSGFGEENFDELDEDSIDLLDELLEEEVNTALEEEVSSELDPFDELIREEEEQQEEDDLLAALGFDDFESENTPDVPQEAEESLNANIDNDEIELDSGLDIDALLNENQPQPEQVKSQPIASTSEEAVNEGLLDESEELASDSTTLANEQDDWVELNDDDTHSFGQGEEEFSLDLDTNELTSEESSDHELTEVSSENTPEQAEEKEPDFTPTPNATENEFGIPQEEDWLIDNVESEPESANAESESVAAEAEDEFDFDGLALPEFGEEDALALMTDEPELPESELEVVAAEAEDEFELDELELPKFGEDDALASMADEPELPESEPEVVAAEAEDEFDFDGLELPEFGEEDALASVADEAELPQSEPEAESTVEEEEFDFDELELPEFSEEDALAAMADEPELSGSEPEFMHSDNEEELEFDESELPEFGEEDALASMAESSSPKIEPSEDLNVTLEADNDHDALFEMFAQQHSFDTKPDSPLISEDPELSGFAESDMENLLSEKEVSETFEGQLDSDTIDSAGMDLETMLDVGDDWDGFTSTSDNVVVSGSEDIPEDEREIWGSEEALNQPEIAQENWEQQSDLEEFDPKKSQFMTIDELMAQVDQEGGEFEEEELKLDVGLNEFPDVIGDINDADVDSDAEAAGKLDLAKIYLEMNDPKGAIKLLEEAIVYGEDEIRREAKNLIDSINGR
ncbi:COG3170 Tfp pilus assembly protein FimV [Vibrio sp. B1FLJ16]|uniref:FimV/HubP family polar landmark protein n=1 Tax=Vibrio sp. B1FLJ16 TaxID=2751178 RepID=UPI0015F3A6F8|nr:FimV/HubP family polar landmark protein [Vibrio sp. B1FLJ16]CAD7808971.1 COG3170 Tfp pilus assembly protein FimV [Vibrio sp. B1FLJ16]CAE6908451.1 COG3170 Tfp pilus assembly protein FimV [Vibrio sp. B1FLJ16]